MGFAPDGAILGDRKSEGVSLVVAELDEIGGQAVVAAAIDIAQPVATGFTLDRLLHGARDVLEFGGAKPIGDTRGPRIVAQDVTVLGDIDPRVAADLRDFHFVDRLPVPPFAIDVRDEPVTCGALNRRPHGGGHVGQGQRAALFRAEQAGSEERDPKNQSPRFHP